MVPVSTRTPPAGELGDRLAAVHRAMRDRELDALLLTTPENVYYLTGLQHQGYFAFTMLVVPVEGDLVLVARAMEAATVRDQAPSVRHVAFADHEQPADGALRAVRDAGITGGRIALDTESMFLPPAVVDALRQGLPSTSWVDSGPIVDGIRLVKSHWELDCIRQAAAISDRAMRAGLEVAGVGVNQREVAATIYHSMILGGSEYPGFVPLVRSTSALLHEHQTWLDRVLTAGDGLLVELSATIGRYHAPLTRLVHVGRPPEDLDRIAAAALDALRAARDALRPGATGAAVYAAWQDVIDDALGHRDYRRHHCGYTVGIGFPPSWVGGSSVVGIRPDGDLLIREGMVFHLLSWVLGQGRSDFAVSDTAVVTADGAELVTSTNRGPLVIS